MKDEQVLEIHPTPQCQQLAMLYCTLKIGQEDRSYVNCSYHTNKLISKIITIIKGVEDTLGGDGYVGGLLVMMVSWILILKLTYIMCPDFYRSITSKKVIEKNYP